MARRKLAKERFLRARRAEAGFSRQLRSVAQQVGKIVNGMAPDGVVSNLQMLTATLRRYSEMLRPWAQAVSERFVSEIARRDATAWQELASEMGRELRSELRTAPTGPTLRQIMAEQVDLITSLPTKAAQRVHNLTIEGLSNSTRAKETASEILQTGHVTKSRAMLIARTETTRTATAVTAARATHLGSEGYFWRTAEDESVRPIHRKLNGKYFRWDDPPIAGENGERAAPGEIYNCRCYPEPVLPDEE